MVLRVCEDVLVVGVGFLALLSQRRSAATRVPTAQLTKIQLLIKVRHARTDTRDIKLNLNTNMKLHLL